jgi:dihydroxy-acid dehydratase
LHVSPEAAMGGNFSLIQNGDLIQLDVPKRSLQIAITEEELEQRRKKAKALVPSVSRGYVGLYLRHVEQANTGADFDFLKGMSGSEVTRDSH